MLAGCGGKPATTATSGNAASSSAEHAPAPDLSSEPNELVVISPHSKDIQYEFTRIFQQKFPEAKIKWINFGGSSDLLAFTLQQYKAKKEGGIGIDVFFGGGPQTFQELGSQGLLEKLPSTYDIPAEMNGVPLRGEKGDWVGAVLSGFGIMYNKPIVARDHLPVPATWADMGNPVLRNRIALADPRHSGSAHMAYEIMLQANGWKKGWEVFTAMAGNARSFAGEGSQVPNDVASGEAVMGPVIDFYAAAKISAAGPDKLAYVEPAGQSIVTPDPIAILRGAPHKDLAEKFIALVMSPVGQKLWMYKKGTPGGPENSELARKAILPALYKPLSPNSLIHENPFGQTNHFKFDPAKSAKRVRALDDLLGSVLIDNQDALKARWTETPDAAKLAFVPVSEEELTKLAEKWDDQTFRNAKIAEWNAAARKKFSR
jgi:ABC-type Fe3+ transport system substrate-binding protein